MFFFSFFGGTFFFQSIPRRIITVLSAYRTYYQEHQSRPFNDKRLLRKSEVCISFLQYKRYRLTIMDIPHVAKKKKSKKEKVRPDDTNAPDSDVSHEQKEKKKSANGTEREVVTDPHIANGDKKKKKKKSKLDEAEVAPEGNGCENVEVRKDKKKKKRKEAPAEVSVDSTDNKESRKKARTSDGHGPTSSHGNYIVHPDVARMSSDEVEALRKEMDMVVLPESASQQYNPLTSFSQLYPSLGQHCPEVQLYIESKGFTKPSPIQA